MPQEPTNADLFVLLENQTDAFKAHAADDQTVAEHQALVNERQETTNLKVENSLDALHEWKDTVATKDDIKEVLTLMKNLNIGIGIFKFSWDNAAKIGGVILLIGAIYLFFKGGFVAVIGYLASKIGL